MCVSLSLLFSLSVTRSILQFMSCGSTSLKSFCCSVYLTAHAMLRPGLVFCEVISFAHAICLLSGCLSLGDFCSLCMLLILSYNPCFVAHHHIKSVCLSVLQFHRLIIRSYSPCHVVSPIVVVRCRTMCFNFTCLNRHLRQGVIHSPRVVDVGCAGRFGVQSLYCYSSLLFTPCVHHSCPFIVHQTSPYDIALVLLKSNVTGSLSYIPCVGQNMRPTFTVKTCSSYPSLQPFYRLNCSTRSINLQKCTPRLTIYFLIMIRCPPTLPLPRQDPQAMNVFGRRSLYPRQTKLCEVFINYNYANTIYYW